MEEMMNLLIWLIFGCLSGLCMQLYNVLWARPQRLRDKLRRQGINGPPPSFLVGNVLEMKRMSSAHLEASGGSPTANYTLSIFPYFEHWRQKYGAIYMYSTGNVLNLYISDPGVVKEIGLFKSLDLGKSVYLLQQLKPLLGFGITRSSGPTWVHQREIITPEFSTEKVKGMVGIMVESSQTLVKSWEHRIEREGGNADIRIGEDLTDFSAVIISKACFGSSCSKETRVFELIGSLQRAISRTTIIQRIPILRYLPTKTNIEVWRLEKEIEKLIIKLVAEGSGKSEGDMLQIILEGALAKQLAKETAIRYVVDNCKNIYVAGHEPVVSVATWTLMLLASFPEWQTRARAEVNDIFQGHPPDADLLHELKTVTMVIQETMRLYPPSPFFSREALEDLRLGDINIPKGVNLWIPITTLHRLPEIWGADADEVKPERFARGIAGACNFPQAYVPFGIGPHICLGQNFAMVELKILLCQLLSKFSFTLSPKYRHSPAARLVIEPKYGMNLIIEKVK